MRQRFFDAPAVIHIHGGADPFRSAENKDQSGIILELLIQRASDPGVIVGEGDDAVHSVLLQGMVGLKQFFRLVVGLRDEDAIPQFVGAVLDFREDAVHGLGGAGVDQHADDPAGVTAQNPGADVGDITQFPGRRQDLRPHGLRGAGVFLLAQHGGSQLERTPRFQGHIPDRRRHRFSSVDLIERSVS